MLAYNDNVAGGSWKAGCKPAADRRNRLEAGWGKGMQCLALSGVPGTFW